VVLYNLEGDEKFMADIKTMADLTDSERRELYLMVAREWRTKTIDEIAASASVKRHVVSGIASRLRKAGVPLPRKAVRSFLTPEFVAELTKASQESS